MSDEFFPGEIPHDIDEAESYISGELYAGQLNVSLVELIHDGHFEEAEAHIIAEINGPLYETHTKPIVLLAQGSIAIEQGRFAEAVAPILESERFEAARGGWLRAARCTVYLARAYEGLGNLHGAKSAHEKFHHYKDQELVNLERLCPVPSNQESMLPPEIAAMFAEIEEQSAPEVEAGIQRNLEYLAQFELDIEEIVEGLET